MPKLEQEKQFKPTEDKLRDICAAYGLTLVSYTLLDGGVENISVRVQTTTGIFVLRILRPGKKSDSALQREVDFMQYLEHEGLPVPKVYYTTRNTIVCKYRDGDTVFRCVLMSYMPGVHVRKYSKPQLKNLATVVAQLEEVGEKYARLRKFPSKKVYRYFNIPLDATLKVTRTDLHAFFERAVMHTHVIRNSKFVGYHHADLDHRNMLFQGSRISALLDFDDAHVTTTEHDLAGLVGDIIWLNKNTEDADYFLKEYARRRKHSPAVEDIKKLVHIFSFFGVKMEIILWGQHGRGIAKTIAHEKRVAKWVKAV